MKFIKTKIPEVIIIEPNVFEDDRGYFFESFKKELFKSEIGKINFIQENEAVRPLCRGQAIRVSMRK